MSKSAFKKNGDEIYYKIVNSLLSAVIFLAGSFIGGEVTEQSLLLATITAFIIFVTQFKDYWNSQEKEYTTTKLFNFVG